MADQVTVTVEAGVADVRLNRPDKLNAIDMGMFEALAEAGEAVAADPEVRAVVLSGQGRAFCAGLDMAEFAAIAGDDSAAEGTAPPSDRLRRLLSDVVAREPGSVTNLGQRAVHVWSELPQPVIAAVHGHALGGGLQIALGADIRIVAPEAKLSVLEIRWGLVPDMTGTVTLTRHVGLDVAKELTFTGRMVSGTEAVALGLATRTAEDPRAAAFELARDIADRSPDAVRAAKRLLDGAVDANPAEAFLAESRALEALRGSPNQIEATLAYLEKRPPRFIAPPA